MFPTQPVRSTMRTRILAPPRARQFSRNHGLLKDWKGSDSTDSSIKRARKGDTNEPTSEATASGLKEREVNLGIQDDTKQQGATERGGRKHAQKAKEEHPAAPEPIIGMNDERAGVRLVLLVSRSRLLIQFFHAEGSLISKSCLFDRRIRMALYSTKWA